MIDAQLFLLTVPKEIRKNRHDVADDGILYSEACSRQTLFAIVMRYNVIMQVIGQVDIFVFYISQHYFPYVANYRPHRSLLRVKPVGQRRCQVSMSCIHVKEKLTAIESPREFHL